MALKMISPTRHPRSGTFRLRMAIPAELRQSAIALYGLKQEIIENLGTKDPKEAKARAPAALAILQDKLTAIQAFALGTTSPITEKQVQALAGRWYQAATRHVGG